MTMNVWMARKNRINSFAETWPFPPPHLSLALTHTVHPEREKERKKRKKKEKNEKNKKTKKKNKNAH